MADRRISRRDFVRDSAVVAAGVAVGLTPALAVRAGNPDHADTSKILNYNADMEYRRCGKTNLMVSCVCLGGHWKRVDKIVHKLYQNGSWLSASLGNPEFEKNRTDVVTRCIERGINYIDACTSQEVTMYAQALKGRRDKMYLGFSWYQQEMRTLGREWTKARQAGQPKPAGWITTKLQETLDNGFKTAGLDYVDLWRITLHEQSQEHTDVEIEEVIEALAWAKRTGRARFTGISSHNRPHIKSLIEKYPGQIEVVCTPYFAKSKMIDDESGLWASIKRHDVGWFGIKPFTSGSLFQDDCDPASPHRSENDRLARLTLRYILCNPAITAPIPGMMSAEQVDNAALAVLERRTLDEKEQAELDAATDRAWANLPFHYQWLKDWEYV